MITNKKELLQYLEADKMALGMKTKRPPIIGKEVWKYQITLRKYEYCLNKSATIRKCIYKYLWHVQGIKLGLYIPPNTCGKGLAIKHYGCVVINPNARIGEYCTIQSCVNIGQTYSADDVPIIGNNVYIGPGAKLFGKISIADGIAIGAGAVVTKSFYEKNITIAGNPAKKIGNRKDGLK